MMYGSAKTWNVPMMAMTTLKRMTGDIIGTVICQAFWSQLAPSMSAAS